MPSSKMRVSKQNIELEIYKTFEVVKSENNVKITEFLKIFNCSIFQNKKYRSIDFTYESLIKLILFKQIKGIKFQTQLERYLKRHPKEKYALGFSKTPDQTTISYFLNHILDKDTKILIDFTADKIIEVSEKFGILFDVNTFEPEKPKKITKDRNQRLQKNDKTREICRLFKKRLSPFVDLHQHHNVKYSKNTLLDLLIHLGLSQDFAENGSKIFKELKKEGPDADTLLYHLKKYDNIDELQEMFVRLFEVIWQMSKQANLFDTRKRVDVAIDYTEWFFYGKNAVMIRL